MRWHCSTTSDHWDDWLQRSGDSKELLRKLSKTDAYETSLIFTVAGGALINSVVLFLYKSVKLKNVTSFYASKKLLMETTSKQQWLLCGRNKRPVWDIVWQHIGMS